MNTSPRRKERIQEHRGKGVAYWVMKADRACSTVLNQLALLGALGLVVVTLMAVIDVVGSKLFNRSLAMAYETTEMLSIPIVYLVIGSVVFGRGPMIVDAALSKFPKRMQTVVLFVGDIIGIGISVIIASRSWIYMNMLVDMHSTTSGAVHILKWPFAGVLCFGWATVALGCLFRMLRPIFKYEPLPDLPPSLQLAEEDARKAAREAGRKSEEA